MSRLDGGIFSRPRGKTANIVFGAARTREGKVVTARELVPPSNPQTAAQQTQRNKFNEALAITRSIGKSIYGSDLNRAVSQLPGFQGLMSILMNNMNDSFLLSAPSALNLGNLHFPNTFGASLGGATGEISINISDENGANGTTSDEVVAVGIEAASGADPGARPVNINTGFTRAAGESALEGFSGGADVVVMLYLRGAGTASGLLSPANFLVQAAQT